MNNKYKDISKERILNAIAAFPNSYLKAAGFSKIPYTSFIRQAKKFGIYNPLPFEKRCQISSQNQKIDIQEILKKDTKKCSHLIKLQLIDSNVKKHECEICKITEWNNLPAPLELDHIDGQHKNNYLENLRIICPNCHSQTPTNAGKKLNSIFEYPDEKILSVINKHSNLSDVLIEISGTQKKKTLHRRARELFYQKYPEQINTTSRASIVPLKANFYTIPINEILAGKHSKYNTTQLKHRLIKEGYKKHQCEVCSNTDWMGQPIPIELDHINGVCDDHRLENVRIICSNCHAQTPNNTGKNVKHNKTHLDISDEVLIEHCKTSTNVKEVITKSGYITKSMPYRRRITALFKIHGKVEQKQTCLPSFYLNKRVHYQQFIPVIENSNIDFSKLGWATKVAEIINYTPQKVKYWMQNHMPEFYEKNCYKRNSHSYPKHSL